MTSLKFLVLGAGVSGLATAIGLRQAGHHVVVLERSEILSDIGAGIQIPPNAARVYGQLGVFDKMLEKSTVLKRISTRRWATNEELFGNPLMPQTLEKYQWPLSFIHRKDLQRILLERAHELGAEILLDHKVLAVDRAYKPRVQVASGEWISGDVVVAADGIKSRVRAQMVAETGIVDRSIPTGDAAYRLIIPRDRMLQDPETKEILDGETGLRFVGPGGHIMMYPICPEVNEETGARENQLLNMAILHPKFSDTPEDESWSTIGSKTEMVSFCKGWAPVIQTLLSYVPDGEVVEWTLNTHLPLSTWIVGSVALMGDACHPMLPYLAQGAAQCVEDAGVFAECFKMTSDVQLGLAVYELARKERAEKIQSSGADVRNVVHLPDGPEQEARDEKYRAIATGAKPDKFVDASWQDFMYGVDVVGNVRRDWDKLVAEVKSK